jgi:Na+-driven multidrug efflux pump
MEFAGANGVSAYGIIMYVGFLFVGTYLGYSIGSAPIISYHYGANNKEELKSLLNKSIKLLGIVAVIMTVFAEIFTKPLASIFVSYDKELLDFTINALRLYSLSYIISWFNIFSSSFFTALNNGFISAMISFLRTLVFQVIAILVLPSLWGINGIWLSVVIAEIFSIIISIICFVKNKKKYEYA